MPCPYTWSRGRHKNHSLHCKSTHVKPLLAARRADRDLGIEDVFAVVSFLEKLITLPHGVKCAFVMDKSIEV
jgi:hypothetical protein